MKIISSWSGGKDSCYALMKAIEAGHELVGILNIMNENDQISRSHGLTKDLLRQQAQTLDVPLKTHPASWEHYEKEFIRSLTQLKAEVKAEAAVFGDIDLIEHRKWEEKVCEAVGITPLLPLWQMDRKKLLANMLNEGMECMIVSCNEQLGYDYLGRKLDIQVLNEFQEIGIDECGENGEYHTIVTNCPLFIKRIELPSFTKTTNNNYNFIQWDN